MYKQRVKHLLFEQAGQVAALKAGGEAALAAAAEGWAVQEAALADDKRRLKAHVREQEASAEELIRQFRRAAPWRPCCRLGAAALVLLLVAMRAGAPAAHPAPSLPPAAPPLCCRLDNAKEASRLRAEFEEQARRGDGCWAV